MKHAALILLLLAGAAGAQPADRAARVAHMVSECRSVMERGLCAVQNSSPVPDEMRRTPMRLGYGLGVVPMGAYIDVQAAGTGMCDLVERACADWDGAQCRVIRSLWRQQ